MALDANDQPTGDLPSNDGGTLSRWMNAIGKEQPGQSEDEAGTQIGAYKLLTQLGEGGFGAVWLAERKQPYTQRVALKLIKPGMDSKSVIARFEQERQALAVMNHPGIAKVLDGGLTQMGRPYFAMEFVKGEPITEFCDHRRLGIRDRLELFVQACEAVQHAHLKGIVHRDIKPSNILAFVVEGEKPRLKVIDFGIAKAMNQSLTEKTIFTETGQMIGTPAYMSPEQADPTLTDIDTRSDVYSLGVLLYELVTGALPFDPKELRSKAIGEIQRIIREEEPPTPSARLTTLALKDLGERAAIERARGIAVDDLARQLRSELEWIPLKAMRKEPHRRYQTAAALADEVRNYLEGRPLLAAPESAAYRLKKYMLRNRAVLVGSSAVGIALMIGLTLAAIAFLNMREEKVRADEAKLEAVHQTRQAQKDRETADKARREAESAARKADEQKRAAELAREELVNRAYFENIQLADALARMRSTKRQYERLDACDAAQRNWEWFWLDGRGDESLAQLGLNSAPIRSIAFAKGGRSLLSVHEDGKVGVWNPETGTLIRSFSEAMYLDAVFGETDSELLLLSDDAVSQVDDVKSGVTRATQYEFDHSEGRFVVVTREEGWRGLAIASMDGRLALWRRSADVWERVGSEVQVGRAGAEAEIEDIAYCGPDGPLLVRTKDGEVRAYVVAGDGASDRLKFLSLRSGSVFACSSEGRTVALAQGARFMVWRGQACKELGEQPAFQDASGTDAITALHVSARGGLLAVARRTGIEVWSFADGAPAMLFREGSDSANGVTWMGFAPDARSLAWASEGGVLHIRSTEPRSEVRTLAGHRGAITCGTWHPSGTLLATASAEGEIRLWDPSTPRTSMQTGDAITDLCAGARASAGCYFSFCTGLVAGFGPSADDLDGRDLLFQRMGKVQIRQIAMHPDRPLMALATDERKVYHWIPESGELDLLGEFEGREKRLKYSPSGKHLTLTSTNDSLYIWDVEGRKQARAPLVHESAITLVEFDQRSRYMATVAMKAGLAIWDPEQGWSKTASFVPREVPAGSEVVHAAFEGDGTRMLVVTNGGEVFRWTWSSDEQVRLPDLQRGKELLVSAQLDSGSGLLLTLDSGGTARVQSLDGRLARELPREGQKFGDGVQQAMFLPQRLNLKARVLTSFKSGAVKLWDAETGRFLVEFETGMGSAPSVALSPDGTRCLIATANGLLHVLDAVPYRVRFAEAQLQAEGRWENLGLLYLREELSGDAASPTWLTDPGRDTWRPSLVRAQRPNRP